MNSINVYSKASGYVKVAIYTDNDTTHKPDVLLNCNDEEDNDVDANEWNSISLPETMVIKDTYYWLAAANDAGGAISYSSGDGDSWGDTITFSGYQFPSQVDVDAEEMTHYNLVRAFAGCGY